MARNAPAAASVARINAWQAIVVALISALSGIIGALIQRSVSPPPGAVEAVEASSQPNSLKFARIDFAANQGDIWTTSITRYLEEEDSHGGAAQGDFVVISATTELFGKVPMKKFRVELDTSPLQVHGFAYLARDGSCLSFLQPVAWGQKRVIVVPETSPGTSLNFILAVQGSPESLTLPNIRKALNLEVV